MVLSQCGSTDRKKNRWRKVCCPNGRKDGNVWSMLGPKEKLISSRWRKICFLWLAETRNCEINLETERWMVYYWKTIGYSIIIIDTDCVHCKCENVHQKAMGNGQWANRKWIYCDWVLLLIYINNAKEELWGGHSRYGKRFVLNPDG